MYGMLADWSTDIYDARLISDILFFAVTYTLINIIKGTSGTHCCASVNTECMLRRRDNCYA
jgi:hypothetical protein